MSAPVTLLVFCFAMVVGILAIIFLIVPLLRGVGWMIGGLFTGIGWVLRHIFQFIAGMLTDAVRFVGAVVAWIVLLPLVLLNVVIGRWSAAGHFFRSMKRECTVGASCLYRVVLQRPLRFLLLGGLLEGLEQRVNEAVDAAPTADKPRRRTGQFEGYTIVGSLPGGGSGAKLYIAEPDDTRRAKQRNLPARVVIKSFALTDGSSLPQIVRESRALEAAKQLGLVFDHGMDEHRFYYVMPYHHGDHLGVITRQLHGKSDGRGLGRSQLSVVYSYVEDLLSTLLRYHRGGLWHKDVKPDNIIIHDNRAHLVDLGLVTPLRSAMTLTTHGTEYFRDPEMVRMALRGVKVHQVDGAKFDIYAVGAVLYFVIENTFPAHGGLSTFSKKSPEAIRWIIRRAMTDYNKRYESAEQMLADLRHVASVGDAYAVKPADLPSMGGASVAEVPPAPEVEPEPVEEAVAVAYAGSPRPPKDTAADDPAVYGLGVAIGTEGVKVARFGEEPSKPDRPRIRVTNWWTGAYEVDPEDVGVEVAGARAQAKAFREQVIGMRRRTSEMRRQARHSHTSARRAAREQIREARNRAREMQRRARAHRQRAVRFNEREPSGMMAFLGLAVVAGIALLVVTLVNSRPSAEMDVQEILMNTQVTQAESNLMGPLSLLLINEHPTAAHVQVQADVDRIVRLHRDQGWEVLIGDKDAEVEVRGCLPPGPFDPERANVLLRNKLIDLNLGGIIRVRALPGEGEPFERTEAIMIAVPKSENQAFYRFEVPVPPTPPVPEVPETGRRP